MPEPQNKARHEESKKSSLACWWVSVACGLGNEVLVRVLRQLARSGSGQLL